MNNITKANFKIKVICFGLIIITNVSLIACNSKKADDFQIALEEINNRHKIIDNDAKNIEDSLYKYKEDDHGFTDEEISIILESSNKNYSKNRKLSKEKAFMDIEYLFKVFKYSYAGYENFGGDERFNAAKESMIKALDKMQQEILASELIDIISRNLGFINDNHFLILNNEYENQSDYKKRYFYTEELEFLKDEKGYYTYVDKEKCYVASINKYKNIGDYFKLSINKEGQLVYYIGLLIGNDIDRYKLEVQFSKEEEVLKKNLTLNRASTTEFKDASYKFSYEDNIPVISIRTFLEQNKDNSQVDFAESGKEAKNYPISIIDIRGNSGGNTKAGCEWLSNYTGKDVEGFGSTAKLWTKFNCKAYNKAFPDNEEVNKLIKENNFNTWETYKMQGTEKWIKNNNIVFVLIDENVLSAGESFVNLLSHLENVIFVGSNTYGALKVGNPITITLPNSYIKIKEGTMFLSYPGFKGDGVGYEPDLWVNPEDSYDRLLKLIKRYKLYSL